MREGWALHTYISPPLPSPHTPPHPLPLPPPLAPLAPFAPIAQPACGCVCVCVRVPRLHTPRNPRTPPTPSLPPTLSHTLSPLAPPPASIECAGRCVGVRACVCVHTHPLVPYGGGTIRGGQGSSAGSGHRMWGHVGPLPPKPPPPPPHNPGTLRWHAGARDGRAGGRGTNLIGCVG